MPLEQPVTVSLKGMPAQAIDVSLLSAHPAKHTLPLTGISEQHLYNLNLMIGPRTVAQTSWGCIVSIRRCLYHCLRNLCLRQRDTWREDHRGFASACILKNIDVASISLGVMCTDRLSVKSHQTYDCIPACS